MTLPKPQILFVITGCLVSFLMMLLPEFSVTTQLFIVGLAISLFGLPHGAVDAFIAKRTGLWRTTNGFSMFFSLYFGLAAFGILAWQIAPVIALAAFFILSAWHFGADFEPQSALERLTFGAMLLSLPAFFAPDETQMLLEALSGPGAAAVAAPLESAAVPLSVAVILITAHRAPSLGHARKALMTIVGLLAFAWLMPPLIYFALYFCALHSARHFGAVLKLLPPDERSAAVLNAMGMTVLTLSFAVIFFVSLIDQISFEVTMTKIIFTGLAALTIPHMALVDGIWHRHFGARA